MSYTTKTLIRVFDDDSGHHVDVAPDADGLDLVELHYVDAGVSATTMHFVPLPPEMARLVARAMLQVADAIEAAEDEAEYCSTSLEANSDTVDATSADW